MAAHPTESSLAPLPLLGRSKLWQKLTAERAEILRHKWLESEKQGQDIGYERALLDWVRHHQRDWSRSIDS